MTWRLTRIVAVVCIPFVVGCAINRSRYMRMTRDAVTGHLTSETAATATTVATFGSKLASGQGKVLMSGKRVGVNQAALGLEAGGDPAAIAAALGPFVKAASAVSAAGSPGLGQMILNGAIAAILGK